MAKFATISAVLVGISFGLCGLGMSHSKYLGWLSAIGVFAFGIGMMGLVGAFLTFILFLFTKEDGPPR